MTPLFYPDAEPWLTARALLREFGDEAREEVWRRACALAKEGGKGEMAAMLALMKAVNALGRSRDLKAVHGAADHVGGAALASVAFGHQSNSKPRLPPWQAGHLRMWKSEPLAP